MNNELMNNLKKLPSRYSTWVVLIVSAVAGYWLQLTPEAQAELTSAYPWLKHVAPFAAVAAFAAARVIPQTPPAPPEAQDTDPTAGK